MDAHVHVVQLGTNPKRLQEVRTSQIIGRSVSAHPDNPMTNVYKALVIERVRRPLFRIAPWLTMLISSDRIRHTNLLIRDVIITREQYDNVLYGVEVYVD